ncbi:hypothetical protein EDB83DRAFT_1512343 [Lactarius deliciosus]|nr:hypothetical protein EDB83DRAFT_1512343 [Lactarius deliciosus]
MSLTVPSRPGSPIHSSSACFTNSEGIARTMEPFFLGPLPATRFIMEFFPSLLVKAPQFKPNIFSDLVATVNGKQDEQDMYDPFSAVISNACDKLIICKTAFRMDTAPSNYGFNLEPDLCVYAKTPENQTLGGTSCSLAELCIKIKKSATSDPFNDDAQLDTNGKLRFVKESKEAQETIGQISTYVAFQMGSQYRTHTFFILVIGMYARLLRWDRSGVVVSERIEYDKQHHLFSFFELFNAATPGIRGWDESVSVPLKHEIAAALEVCP